MNLYGWYIACCPHQPQKSHIVRPCSEHVLCTSTVTHRKVAITIYVAVLGVSLPVNLYLRPLLLSSGLSKLEAFFTGACIISIGMVYFTSPLVSYLARPFLRPWPTKLFDRLTQVNIT